MGVLSAPRWAWEKAALCCVHCVLCLERPPCPFPPARSHLLPAAFPSPSLSVSVVGLPHCRTLASAAGVPVSCLAHSRCPMGSLRGCEGAVGRPRTWPGSGGHLVGELVVCMMACLCTYWWSHCQGNPGEGGKGLRGHRAWHLGPPHPEDSEEASVVGTGLMVAETFLPMDPNPSKRVSISCPSWTP